MVEFERQLEDQPANIDHVLEVLATDGSAAGEAHRGAAFAFPDAIPRDLGAKPLTEHSEPEFEAGLAWVRDLAASADPVMVASAPSGRIATVCYSASASEQAAEAYVATTEAYRGRGFGTAVLAAWARAVREGGRTPLFSTCWDNTVGRALAAKLRLVCYGDDTVVY